MTNTKIRKHKPGPKAMLRRWIKALTGGKYQQAKRTLVRGKAGTKGAAYCCIGVACEVARASGLPVRRAHGGSAYRIPKSLSKQDPGVHKGNVPTDFLTDTFGLPKMMKSKWDGGRERTCERVLASMNDSEHKTFGQIASRLALVLPNAKKPVK